MRRLSFVVAAGLLAGCGGNKAPVAVPEAAVLKKLPPGLHRETADVPRVGPVKYTIEVPAAPAGAPLVLALHYGYDGAKPAPYTGAGLIEAFRPGLAGLGAVVIAPDALGGDWTDPKNETAAVWLTRCAAKTYTTDPKRVVVTGFSLGGEGAWFLGSRHQDLFTGAIPVAAPVVGGDAAWTIPAYVVHSDADTVVRYAPAKKHAEALRAKGAAVEFRTVTGLTHYKPGEYARYVGDGVTWLKGQWK